MSTPSEAPAAAGASPGKAGRPSLYSHDLAETICRLIVTPDPTTGRPQSVRSICQREDMPHRDTVYGWLLVHKDFAELYGRAMELRADQMFDECLDIADDARGDYRVEPLGDEGIAVEIVDKENIARARLRIDTRKWMAGKMAPKKYGDRLVNEHVGKNGGPIETKDVTDDKTRARALAAFIAKTRKRA
ncbi:MAG TPA: terminase small subunit protein [Xanthobacteraceae bacterium]|nr:terminase small subunit protein [Xanthobacteraceae bacterium]